MKTTIAVIFCLMIFAGASRAQTGSDADSLKVDLDNLLDLSLESLMNVRVITPTLNLQQKNTVPSTVMVVSANQIRLRGYRNLAEILNDLPDFIVNDKSDPQIHNVIGARGFVRQEYFVILLDGIRISSPTNEPLPILENFPIYLAKQIEVAYGPGSALYGADAMAGVINIITRDADDPKVLRSTVMGGTHGYSNASVLFNKRLKHMTDVSIGGQYTYDAQPDFSKIYDEYDVTSHKTGIFNTDYGVMSPVHSFTPEYEAPLKSYNVYASLKKAGFAMRALHHYVAVPTSITLSPDNAVYNKDVFYGHGVTMASASYTFDAGDLKSMTSLTGSLYEVNPKSSFQNLYGGMNHGYKYGRGSMMKFEEQLNYSFSEKLGLTGGITYEIFNAIPKTPELEAPVRKDQALGGTLLNSKALNNPGGIEAKFFQLHYSNAGAYVQAQYFPVSQFSLTTGVRYDHNSRFGSTINPRVGAVYNPWKNTTVKALYGTAFLAPSPLVSFDSYGSFYTMDSGNTYRSSFWHLPNPGLKPITSRTLEVSVNHKLGKSFGITLTGYKSEVRNMTTDVSDAGNTNLYNSKFMGWEVDYIEVTVNKGTQTNYGGNLMVNATFEIGMAEFNAYSSLSYLEGTKLLDEDAGSEIEQAAITPVQFRAGLDMEVNSFYFSVRLLQAGKQRMTQFVASNPSERQALPGYSLLNVSAGYAVSDHISVFGKVQNALNSTYMNSLMWASTDFEGSYQDPIRGILGVRLGL